MDEIIKYIGLFILGACFGSFGGASVWRLRAIQLKQDKKDGEKVDEAEYEELNKLNKSSFINDHSQCLKCGYKLHWYDLIPLLSWLALGGKCRKCHKKIGYFEPLMEIGVGLFFLFSYIFWSPESFDSILGIAQFIIWLFAGVGLAILFAYDSKWFLLPDKINFSIVGLGVVNSIIAIIISHDRLDVVASIVSSIFVLSGIYWILFQVSKGKWIGFGDIKLGLGLALMIVDWKLAFLALFLANLFGCMVVLPGILSGNLKRSSHIPFGPFLIMGYVFATLLGGSLIEFYLAGIL